MKSQSKSLYVVLVLATILAGCDDATEPGDLIVEGVNLTELFAPPTQDETNAILAEWASRDPVAADIDTAIDTALTVGTVDVRLRIVSHDVSGVTHYGAIMVPDGAQPGTLPVLMYLHGGDNGENLDWLLPLLPIFLEDEVGQFVFVLPSFRSERLRFGGVDYVSDGPSSPWDWDVDDAIALLNVALATTPEADADNIGAIGFSRGGGVGLLMAERDPRVEVLVEFFGPTDFHGPFVMEVAEEALLGTLRDLPGLAHLDSTFIQPLKRGEMTIEDVRPELTRRSAVYFADLLPQLQVHHGTDDQVVPVGEAERLIEVMQGLGRGAPGFEYYLYEGGGHDPLTLTGSFTRATDFLSRLTAAPLAYR
jgi:acetyl esterase/lipase